MTWLTNQNCHFGVLGKFPAVLFVALALVLDDELQAEISAEAAAVALNSPAPLSSLRRAGPSCMFEGLYRLVDNWVDFFLHVDLHGIVPGHSLSRGGPAG